MKLFFISFIAFYYLVFQSSCHLGNNNRNQVDEHSRNEINTSQNSINLTTKSKNCDTPLSSVDIIIFTDETDEQPSFGVFFHEVDGNGNILSNGEKKVVPTDIFVPNTRFKTKLSEPALRFLAEFIDKNCICNLPNDMENSEYYGMYQFQLIQEKQAKICYIFLSKEDKYLEYFRKLRNWLSNSEYNKEYLDFIIYIESYILKSKDK
ncbi:MAG TPA: hypothetical protein VLZ83_11405 [Edaphocola sp.]|nr:hypothetical protein [Edaphocola sp.]